LLFVFFLFHQNPTSNQTSQGKKKKKKIVSSMSTRES